MKTNFNIMLVATFLSVKPSVEEVNVHVLSGKSIQDSIVRKIPLGMQSARFKKLFRKYQKAVMIDSLTNGTEGEEIRVWNSYARSDTFQLLRIRNISSKWSMEFYTIVFKNAEDSFSILKKDVLTGIPKSGWSRFTYSIFHNGIKTLPDYSEIKGYDLPFDGGGPTVEIANKKFYKIYSYPLPRYYSKRFPQAKKMAKLLRLLENEFGFTWM